MSDQSSFDMGSVAMLLVIIVVLSAVTIKLIPIIVQIVWHVLPGILVLWLIVAVLRNMVHKLLE
jgi:hypothetical protein